jgi:hypothetical protein
VFVSGVLLQFFMPSRSGVHRVTTATADLRVVAMVLNLEPLIV